MVIYSGDKIAIVGPSGAGKTTLAHILSQIKTPTEGSVSFNKEDTRIGFLSQNPYILQILLKII